MSPLFIIDQLIAFTWSYAYFWCMEFQRYLRILIIDFMNNFNNKEIIYHESLSYRYSLQNQILLLIPRM